MGSHTGLIADPGDHVVQFYGADDELVATVGAYLAAAVERRETAVVVATSAHREAFADYLGRAGIDVAAAVAAGDLLVLDAEQTMHEFVIDGQLDRERFDETVGSLMRRVTAVRPAHVYGEMVALLWESGQINAVLELEQSWNELSLEAPFSLICGYPRDSVADQSQAEALKDVCRLHSAVVGVSPPVLRPPLCEGSVEVARDFSSTHWAPADARRFVCGMLQATEAAIVVQDAALVVTELAANAVRHARSDFTVSVHSSPDVIRISVVDRSPLPPAPREALFAATSGRGLGIVAAVSKDWAAEPHPDGKVVWAELERRHS